MLDYYTNAGISGATVYSVSVTGTSIFAYSGTASDGSYTLNVPTSGQIIYVPFASGYRGYSRQLENYIDNVNLFLISGYSTLDSTSGSMFTSLYNALLTTSTNTLNLKTTPCNGVVITDGGLDVFDVDTLQNTAYIVRSGGFSALYVNPGRCEVNVFMLGTTTTGVQQINYSTTMEGNIGSSVSGYRSVPNILSNSVTCIHGNNRGDYVIGTTSGIDLIFSGGVRYYHTFSGGVSACYISSSGDVYYSPVNSGIYCKFNPISAIWTSPDYNLDSTTTPALSGNYINDIDITETTSGSTYTYNVFLATNSGITAYIENRSSISSSTTKTYKTVISGGIYNVTGVELEAGALVTSGYIILSTLSGTGSGVVQRLNTASDSIDRTYTYTDFESNLRRAGITLSGSKYLHRR